MSDEPNTPPTPPAADAAQADAARAAAAQAKAEADRAEAAAADAKATATAKPRKRHGCLFRSFVLFIVLLLLVAGLLVGVQWALQNTDYARNIALPIVERKLGLRLHAKGLKVSLFGHTELTDVSAGLPLDDQDFLHVPVLKVKHANLLQIIIDRGVSLDDITIERPTVDVVKDKYGQWNLLRVIDILGKLGGSNDPQPTATSGGVPKLPAVHLVDGTIKINDGGGHYAEVAPLNVTGQPDQLLTWRYDLHAGPKDAELLAVTGIVAPGNTWAHRLTAAVGHLDPLAQAFGSKAGAYDASVNANWVGQLTDGKVGGRLTLTQVSATGVPVAGDVSIANGVVDVTTGGTAPAAAAVPAGAVAAASAAPLVTLAPANLVIKTTKGPLPELGVLSGQLVYDATGVHARGLKVAALGGAASADLAFDPKSQNVDVSAHWSGLTLAAGIRQAGSLTASLRQPFPGQPLIRVEVDDQGSLGEVSATAAGKGGTRWDAGVALTGQGSSWSSIDWVLGVPKLRVDSGAKSYDLSGISAVVQQRPATADKPATVDLLGLTLPPSTGASTTVASAVSSTGHGVNAVDASSAAGPSAGPAGQSAVPAGNSPFGLTFAASAHVDLPDKAKGRKLKWTASASGGVLASYAGSPLPVTLTFDALGDDRVYTLRRFVVNAADATLRADGSYDVANQTKPVALHVQLTQTPRVNPNAPIQGTFHGDFQVVGLLFATDLAADPLLNPAVATRPGGDQPRRRPRDPAGDGPRCRWRWRRATTARSARTWTPAASWTRPSWSCSASRSATSPSSSTARCGRPTRPSRPSGPTGCRSTPTTRCCRPASTCRWTPSSSTCSPPPGTWAWSTPTPTGRPR